MGGEVERDVWVSGCWRGGGEDGGPRRGEGLVRGVGERMIAETRGLKRGLGWTYDSEESRRDGVSLSNVLRETLERVGTGGSKLSPRVGVS